MDSRKAIRKAAARSLEFVAVCANVSAPTARLYELAPDAIASPQKREALERVYAELAREVEELQKLSQPDGEPTLMPPSVRRALVAFQRRRRA